MEILPCNVYLNTHVNTYKTTTDMVELKKETLLHYFPYRKSNGGLIENKSIYHVLLQLEENLWGAMNVNGELALRLFDYQADISQRKKHFEKMRDDLPEELQKQQQQFQQERKKLVDKFYSTEVQQAFPNLPYDKADDPEAVEEAFAKLRDDYADLLDKLEEIQEDFDKKMEGISKVKLNNTDPFTREDVKDLNGKLVKAVRPLIQDKKEAGQK